MEAKARILNRKILDAILSKEEATGQMWKHLEGLDKFGRSCSCRDGVPEMTFNVEEGEETLCLNCGGRICLKLNPRKELVTVTKLLQGCIEEAKELLRNQDIPEDWERLLKRGDKAIKRCMLTEN